MLGSARNNVAGIQDVEKPSNFHLDTTLDNSPYFKIL